MVVCLSSARSFVLSLVFLCSLNREVFSGHEKMATDVCVIAGEGLLSSDTKPCASAGNRPRICTMTAKRCKLHAVLSSPGLQTCHLSASHTHITALSQRLSLHHSPSSSSPSSPPSLLSSSLSFSKLSLSLFQLFFPSPLPLFYITKRKKITPLILLWP